MGPIGVFKINLKKGYSRKILFSGTTNLQEDGRGQEFRGGDYFYWIFPDYDIICLCSGAEGYILLSFYEGFPMTAFEAMACGCPVLASKTSSMPKAIGSAGLYFDPEKPE